MRACREHAAACHVLTAGIAAPSNWRKVKSMAQFRVIFISRDDKARILILEAASRSEALIKAGPAREGESVTVEEDK